MSLVSPKCEGGPGQEGPGGSEFNSVRMEEFKHTERHRLQR